MNFGDNNIYFISFGMIILTFIIFHFTKVNLKIKKHQAVIAYIFAALQFLAFLASVVNNLFIDLAWEKSMLQDLCPAIQFVAVIIFIANNERGYKMLMPWLIIGSTITMLSSPIPIFSNPIKIISYLRHVLMLIQGLLAYVWVGAYSYKEKWEILVFPSLLIVYLFIVGFIPWQITGDSRWVVFSTALFEPAVAVGTKYEILSSFGIPYPIPTLIFYALACFAAWVIAYSKTFLPMWGQKIKNKHLQKKLLKNSH